MLNKKDKLKKILVTGSLAFDHIMDFPESFEENIIPEKLKALSVSFLAKNFSKNYGGVAGNIAYSLALLGQKVAILASVGQMDFAPYQKHLRKTGVDLSFVCQKKETFTANMFMITDINNCQIAGFYPGAMSVDRELSVRKTFKTQKFDFAVIAPTVPEAMGLFVKEVKMLDIPYLFDPAQQIPRLSSEQLKEGLNGAEILICNDYERALITKKTGFSEKQILARVKILITTLGEKGSRIQTGTQKFEIGISNPRQVVDPTGAGDGYIAGFLAGYLGGFPLQTCGQLGATVATCAIEHYGTQKHKFTLAEFKNRYKEAFGKKLILLTRA